MHSTYYAALAPVPWNDEDFFWHIKGTPRMSGMYVGARGRVDVVVMRTRQMRGRPRLERAEAMVS